MPFPVLVYGLIASVMFNLVLLCFVTYWRRQALIQENQRWQALCGPVADVTPIASLDQLPDDYLMQMAVEEQDPEAQEILARRFRRSLSTNEDKPR